MDYHMTEGAFPELDGLQNYDRNQHLARQAGLKYTWLPVGGQGGACARH
jgi:hypothetical protein